MFANNNNDEENGNADMNWKLARSGKTTALLRKSKQHEHG
jgi:hypothetical protein